MLPTEEDKAINDLLNDAYLIKNGLAEGMIPDLRPYSRERCVKAVEAMKRDPGVKVGNETTYTCSVDSKIIPVLYAWSVSAWELEAIVRQQGMGR